MAHVLADVLETTRRIATEVAGPEAVAIDSEARWPAAALRSLQREGLGGLVVPASFGGMGQGLLGLAHVCETLGRVCGSTAICFGMHQVAAAVIAAKATPDHVERYLTPIVRGEHLTTLALSEPGTGAHFYYPQTRFEAGRDLYRATGTKAFVTNGSHADSYVISGRIAGVQQAAAEFSCAVVPANAAGLRWGPPWNGVGMRGNSARSVDLVEVAIPRDDLLGREGDQTWYVFQVIAPYFLVAMAGTYLGIADRAVAETIASMRDRRYDHTHQSLSEVGILQHQLGRIWARLQAARKLVHWAAQEGDSGGSDATAALTAAKAEVAECVNAVVGDCMTLAGGRAYQNGSVLERLLRDARAAHIMAPTTDVLHAWTGRTLLGLPLLDDPGVAGATSAETAKARLGRGA